MLSNTQIATLKGLIFCLCLVPLALLASAFFRDALGANPIETITHATGDWTLRFLLITLAVTPLRKLTHWHWLVRLRRMLGLYAFFYGTLHLATYLVLDQFFDWNAVVLDVLKRPYITVGFSAFVLMVPLAVTSTNAMIRRLGGRRWQALHRSVYAIAILGVLHFWWLVKADVFEPLIYALILAVLLSLRAWWREQERRRQQSAPPPLATGRSRIIPILPR
ncbi:sulfoxide reductase heme-binding subunit YedZ [Denitromonas sp. IR12]|uniref:Protein-methionine-sulfoxide reductase heme-binding subunit MsrQ n=2 Tax=Denitromonas iodatirespirans TaxID=2795389 RepID=A0A944DI99_DENI1|nr:protein-methionine-sulfoxide reductase heme-binding subunit MsrQ [Denitromonas iodatirespirans]MBT0963378.1 sulfoxide reductase heme-binding subunit YedZ [Denitromonas iodatirespirans]